jgi:hypothetical protein
MRHGSSRVLTSVVLLYAFTIGLSGKGECEPPISALAAGQNPLTAATIDGTEPGWRSLGESDFVNVNCFPGTWVWTGGAVHCTGRPIGVIRTVRQYTNFELIVQWKHLQPGGNSGIFVWASEAALRDLEPDKLPASGIEIQILDHGYTRQFEESSGRKANWFTTHGDVFPVGASKMKPFAPTSPDGTRSFPRLQLSKGVGECNSYYVRCINGEVRLWVNGTEVSGGSDCQPDSGYLCLESEGAPIEFNGVLIRVLP